MKLVKIKSQKHKGCIFLKEDGTEKHFICKVYPQGKKTDEIADKIIEALR